MSDKLLFSLNTAIARICLKLTGNLDSEEYATAYHECFQKQLQATSVDLIMSGQHFQKLIQESGQEKLPSLNDLFSDDE